MRPLLVAFAAVVLAACNQSEPATEAAAGGTGGERGGAGQPAQQPSQQPPDDPAGEEPPAEVGAAPLGSEKNPVRCDMPAGERAYLDRLRCPDGSPPRYERLGSTGEGPHGNVLDAYRVLCGERETTIYMDMYDPGHVETEPVDGFTIVN